MRTLRLLTLVLLLASLSIPLQAASPEPSGPVIIAGNGPELYLIEELRAAFEKKYRRAYVDIFWQEHLKPLEMVRGGDVNLVVTGKEEPDLVTHQIGWDGIALMVHVTNTTSEITLQKVAQIYTGQVKFWSELGGPDLRVKLIDRPPNGNVRHAFLKHVGINGKIPKSAKVIGPDVKATNLVAGTLPPSSAIAYMALAPALEAVKTGVAVRLLFIDNIEPELPTVKDGRYKLRRPMLLLSKGKPNHTVQAFINFARSQTGQRILKKEGYVPLHE